MPHPVSVWCRCHRSQLATAEWQPGSRSETGTNRDPALPWRMTRHWVNREETPETRYYRRHPPAFERACGAGRSAVLELVMDPDQITPDRRLSA